MSKISIIGEGSVSDLVRSFKAGEILKERGYNVGFQNVVKSNGQVLAEPDTELAIFSRPLSPEAIRFYRENGAVVIVDQDDDFAAIPQTHVGYKSIGRGNPKFLSSHLECLREADLLTVSTPELASRFAKHNSNILVIPNGWDNTGPKARRTKFNWFSHDKDVVCIGWAGTITHREDFKIVIEPLRVICREFPNVRILIAGDPENYNTLHWLEEHRKKFYPFMSYEDYSLFIDSLDILLVPLVDDEFNRAKSDIKLVDAGAAGIPWIASPLPQYTSWGGGGIVANSPNEWAMAMEMLVTNPEDRKKLGEVGRTLAQNRTFDALSYLWRDAFESALSLRTEQRAHSIHLHGQPERVELLGMESDDPIQSYSEARDS